ncbi:hypothetical protein MGU_00259 [Metarhizium guizhouense ARSEF 977]|uniref:DUF6594 domain-containing protein n=1 Tax=Metarhizium guizhouense (strain ARSEF 977) TaxID=1276136 RepID=A0A0B4GYN0_METGA|nr:hypothetical protein MGU_00259 [Metarhizium guizhouense ARSEF 977]
MTDDGKMETVKDAELFDYVCTSQIDEETFHFLGFKFLHHLNIVRIQNDLIVLREHISRTRRENLEKEKLSKLLNEYSEDSERLYRSKEFGDAKPTDEISTLVDNLVRLLIALVAVLVPVAPMFIISVHPSPKKSLIPSSAFMIMFACVLSFAVKTSYVEALVATATYLAALMVFVGANSSAG